MTFFEAKIKLETCRNYGILTYILDQLHVGKTFYLGLNLI